MAGGFTGAGVSSGARIITGGVPMKIPKESRCDPVEIRVNTRDERGRKQKMSPALAKTFEAVGELLKLAYARELDRRRGKADRRGK